MADIPEREERERGWKGGREGTSVVGWGDASGMGDTDAWVAGEGEPRSVTCHVTLIVAVRPGSREPVTLGLNRGESGREATPSDRHPLPPSSPERATPQKPVAARASPVAIRLVARHSSGLLVNLSAL